MDSIASQDAKVVPSYAHPFLLSADYMDPNKGFNIEPLTLNDGPVQAEASTSGSPQGISDARAGYQSNAIPTASQSVLSAWANVPVTQDQAATLLPEQMLEQLSSQSQESLPEPVQLAAGKDYNGGLGQSSTAGLCTPANSVWPLPMQSSPVKPSFDLRAAAGLPPRVR